MVYRGIIHSLTDSYSVTTGSVPVYKVSHRGLRIPYALL